MDTIDLDATAAEETKAETTDAGAGTGAAADVADDPWGSFGTKKDKKKKKSTFSWADEPEPAPEPVPEPVVAPEPEPAPAEDDWGFTTTTKKKKGKKGKVSTIFSILLHDVFASVRRNHCFAVLRFAAPKVGVARTIA